MNPVDSGKADKQRKWKILAVFAVLITLVILPMCANPKATKFLPDDSLIKAILQILGTVYVGLALWVFLVMSLVSAPAVNPIHRLKERYRSILHSLPNRKAWRRYGIIALTIVVLLVAWYTVGTILFRPNDAKAFWWFVPPFLVVVLGIFMVTWVGFFHLIAPVARFVFDVLSLPIRTIALRMGVEEFGALLESLGVVLIGLSLVFGHLPMDKDLTNAARQFFVSMEETHWLERIGVLSAAVGGTYRIVKHITRKEKPATTSPTLNKSS